MMNATVTSDNPTALNLDLKSNIVPFYRETESTRPQVDPELEMSARILREKGGQSLEKFCKNLRAALVRTYMVQDDPNEMHDLLCENLVERIRCTNHQARCLIELTLEMIHIEVHGDYRNSGVEMGYLISMGIEALKNFTGGIITQ